MVYSHLIHVLASNLMTHLYQRFLPSAWTFATEYNRLIPEPALVWNTWHTLLIFDNTCDNRVGKHGSRRAWAVI